MNDQSERIPVGDLYLRALGRATYNFVYLEWGIVWLTETLEPGFLHTATTLTAGQIAGRFTSAIMRLPDSDPDKEALVHLATSFGTLVEDRNRLMHGTPFTAPGGEQRLMYDGKHGRKDWTIELIAEFSSVVAAASIRASELRHYGIVGDYKLTRTTLRPDRHQPFAG